MTKKKALGRGLSALLSDTPNDDNLEVDNLPTSRVGTAHTVGEITHGITEVQLDEIEVNPLPDPVPPISDFIEIAPAAGFSITWDKNEGLFSTPSTPSRVPGREVP